MNRAPRPKRPPRTPGIARHPAVLAIVALLLASSPLHAQAPAGTIVLSGRVVTPEGEPVPAARIRAVVLPGEAERSTMSDGAGGYRLSLPDDTETVILTVERQGHVPRTISLPVTDRAITRDLRMETVPLALPPVVAEAQRRRPGVAPFRAATPGESFGSQGPVGEANLPGDPGSLSELAGRVPGALAVGGEEGGLPAISIGGQDPTQTRTTLDGAGYGAGELPPEAIGRADVVTSSYDVSRGRYSGGQIAVQTRAGGAVWAGALGLSLRPPHLSRAGPGEGGAVRGEWFGQASGGGGGPIVPGRLYVYGAAAGSRRSAASTFLAPSGAAGVPAPGVDADTVARFYDALARAGIAAGEGGEERVSTSGSGIARLDWLPGERHAVMARFDARGSRLDNVGSTPLTARGEAGRIEMEGAGGLLQLTSRWGSARSELRAGVSTATRTVGAGSLPRALVRVGPPEGGSFLRAGAPLLPGGDHRQSAFELTHDLQLSLPGGRHRLRAGYAYHREEARLSGSGEGTGTFLFDSLEELEAGRPASYSRLLAPEAGRGSASQLALYAGDEWTPRPGLAILYGARLELARYPHRPALDTALARLPGAPGPGAPSSLTASPRAGFTYRTGADLALRGGIGRFQGVLPVALLARALGETGGPGAAVHLFCPGASAPSPEWARYREDPGALPERCVDGTGAVASRAPRATLLSDGFRAPSTWQATLAANRRLRGVHFLDVEAGVALGRYALAFDRNLGASPAFSLVGEGGRPVFAPRAAIDPGTGAVSLTGARPVGTLGPVRVLEPGGRSSTLRAGVGLTGVTPWQGAYQLHYTWSRSLDRTTGTSALGGSSATTAADPRRAEWGHSDLHRSHYLQGHLTHRPRQGVDLGVVVVLHSGIPYTPLVEGDVNGDGAQNDRAFVFDPRATADPAVAEGMARLLDAAPRAARACLRGSLGLVAERNACRSPWGATLDLQANLRPGALGRSRRLYLRIATQNLLAGVDRLLNGTERSRGWGQLPWADPVLLRVRGFDAEAGAFHYEVNPAFGEPIVLRSGARRPFGIVVQGRITVGADPAFQQIAGAVEALGGAARSPEALLRELEARLPNVPQAVLAEDGRRRLELTPEQALHLRTAADSLASRLAEVRGGIAAALAEGANRYTPTVRALAERGQGLVEEGMDEVRRILTPRQWNRLPRRLREPAAEDPVPGERVSIPAG